MLQSAGETSPYHPSLAAPGNSIATGEGQYAAGTGFLPPTPSSVTIAGPNSGNSNSSNDGQSEHLAALAQNNNLYSHWAAAAHHHHPYMNMNNLGAFSQGMGQHKGYAGHQQFNPWY